MTDAEINEGMKWSELQTRQSGRIDAIWQPARKRMYLMMDVLREVDLPVSSPHFHEATESAWHARTGEHTRDHFHALEAIKSRCREEQRLLFDAFKAAYKWQLLEKIKMRGYQLRSVQGLDALLERYFALDAQLTGIEHHYEEATNALEAAAQFQYELKAGK